MGVLNVTPDSFSDGGRWVDPEAAVAHARELISQGADIIDIGINGTQINKITAVLKLKKIRKAKSVSGASKL